jgi:hypothetical protein
LSSLEDCGKAADHVILNVAKDLLLTVKARRNRFLAALGMKGRAVVLIDKPKARVVLGMRSALFPRPVKANGRRPV